MRHTGRASADAGLTARAESDWTHPPPTLIVVLRDRRRVLVKGEGMGKRHCLGCIESIPIGDNSFCKECYLKDAQERRDLARRLTFNHYGNACACCGATEPLEVDHIQGGGEKHRSQLGGKWTPGRPGRTARFTGWHFYEWLIANNFPHGYQTLCGPCNRSKHDGPRCRLDHASLKLEALVA